MNPDRYNRCCFYCTHNETLHERMIEIKPLHVSTFYLNRDQTHRGRSIVALNWHVDELFQLSNVERNEFADDVAHAAQTLAKVFSPDKINYAIYGDSVSHLHVHLVPKYKTDFDWDDAFVNNPSEPKKLTEYDYQNLIQGIKANLVYEEDLE
ncbi:HIT family protein [Sporolactobacillus terrae]|uniref:HIT family protein n=2 Tax=Sporolactobacillus terrae TaxID=269673 RepID=A0ABX5QBG5_9BACL|nr:HIT family protein [Sporolactobacillus terrae]QAA26918.1 HIT family protein [Sporolactobacillus terrae]UAK17819.1 HIT family protein [Sporolactobacillus terrae]